MSAIGNFLTRPKPAQDVEPLPLADTPTVINYNKDTNTFTGTMALMVKLAMRAIQALGWKLDQINETIGLVTFETGMSWGSWSGVSCALNIEEISQTRSGSPERGSRMSAVPSWLR
jgi:hypothetical protein